MALAEQQLGHYRLTRLIGQGGMGEVYLAEDTRISRQVAVKVVRTELQSYLDDEESQHAEELFEREMKAISRLDHPYILSFYDFGKEPAINGSIVYMMMPYRQLIITHIFRDTFMSHGDKPSCIKETMYDLCFGNPFYRRLQKLVGNDKIVKRGPSRIGFFGVALTWFPHRMLAI